MASIRRQGDRCEIRECVSTPQGPRQRTLARFDGALTPEALDSAAAKASKPLDRDALVEAARHKGIPVDERRRHSEARAVLAMLQRGGELEPTLVRLLATALERLVSLALPPHLEDAAEWIGQPEHERGAALRGLLRTADRILRSRPPLRTPPPEPFPRFRSAPDGAAS